MSLSAFKSFGRLIQVLGPVPVKDELRAWSVENNAALEHNIDMAVNRLPCEDSFSFLSRVSSGHQRYHHQKLTHCSSDYFIVDLSAFVQR